MHERQGCFLFPGSADDHGAAASGSAVLHVDRALGGKAAVFCCGGDRRFADLQNADLSVFIHRNDGRIVAGPYDRLICGVCGIDRVNDLGSVADRQRPAGLFELYAGHLA